MIKTKISLLNDVVITYDNIQSLGRAIALKAVKCNMRYSFYNLNKVYKDLVRDLYNHKELDTYSNSYDLVQEAVCFLCSNVGKKLGDIYGLNRRTHKLDTIRYACFGVVSTYLRKEIKITNNEENNDELLEFVTIENEIEKELPDYSKIIEIATKIVNTPLEKEILKYFYNGASVNNIAEFLSISTDKVYKRRRKFKDRYALYFK